MALWLLKSVFYVVASLKRCKILPTSVARRNPRKDNAARKYAVRASALENWSTVPSADERARLLFLPTLLSFFYTILSPTERGASAVVNLGSPRYTVKMRESCRIYRTSGNVKTGFDLSRQ